MIIDTHAHYDDDAFDEDREEILHSLSKLNVKKVINSAATYSSIDRVIEMTEQYDFMYVSLGVHPTETAELTEEKLNILLEKSKHPKCVAIGEIGLDYYWNEPEKEMQQKWFRAQLEIARQAKLPVVIHSRDAAKDTLELMKECQAGEIGGTIHCYSYSREMARDFLDLGFYFGIGGVVTFSNGKKMKDVVEYLPMDRILLETDSPYLSPVPYRGKRNYSGYLPHVVAQIAAIKGISTEEVERITWENAHLVYPKLGKEE